MGAREFLAAVSTAAELDANISFGVSQNFSGSKQRGSAFKSYLELQPSHVEQRLEGVDQTTGRPAIRAEPRLESSRHMLQEVAA